MKKRIMIIAILLIIIAISVTLVFFLRKDDDMKGLTLKDFEQLEFGMTTDEVRNIVGEANSLGITGRPSENYYAYNENGNRFLVTIFYHAGALVEIIVNDNGERYDLLKQ